jgi:hypothetical protein
MSVEEAQRVLATAANVYPSVPFNQVVAADPKVEVAWRTIQAHFQRIERDLRLGEALLGLRIADLADQLADEIEDHLDDGGAA